MEDKTSLARKQDELLAEHLFSVGGYNQSPPSLVNSTPTSTPTHAKRPEQLPNVQQQEHYQRYLQQQQQQQQQQRPSPYQSRDPRQQDAFYMAGQQRYNYYPAGNAPIDRPGYQGLSALGQTSLAAGVTPGALPRPASAGSPVMRANTMYIPHAGSPVAMHQQPSYPRPPYTRYSEHDYDEHQQRQYEQYEQRSRYYREATPSLPSLQEYPPRRATSTLQHRPSVYQGAHVGSQQSRPLQSPRQHQILQLHAQRSLNLGSLNRLPISRDQLPTAPSPPASSATEPAPVYPESSETEPQSSASLHGPFSDAAASSTSLPLSESALSSGSQNQESQPVQYLNRNNTHSSKSTGSPGTTERLMRPTPPALDANSRYQMPVISHNPYNSSSSSLSTLARSGTQSQWDPTNCAMVMQSKSRAALANSYSRQFTLSSIPANEEVPPLPGKMSSKTGKVRIQLTFDRPFFNAGGELSGRLEVQCSSSRSVMLADMIIELLGYEALAKDHLAPKVFHKTVLRLQDLRHPSQAVQEHVDPDAEGYWLARKGRTIFPFRLNIQDTLPNSYDSKLGHVRYAVSAIALMKANHHKEIVNHTREVFIYETWTTDDIAQARRKSVKADTSKRLFMGGEGSLEMYAELTRTMVSSGGIVYVNVGVKNLTKKKIMGIKLSLWRHIAASHTRSSMNSQLSTNGGSREQDNVKNYSEIIYKGEDYAFDNDDPRVVVLPVYIPSGVYSLRNTSYLHVQFFVQVSLMASMSKALAVELPIYIAHASSWSDPPPRIPRDFCFPLHEDEPVKKNKTGVFTKKKPSAVTVHSTGSTCSTSSLKKSNANGCLSSASTSASAPTSLSGTPNNSDAGATDSSRPTTQRSTLKDPDSPTSVLDFSQAGNLFVVNPDAASIFNGSDTRPLLKQPLATRSVPSQRALDTGPAAASDFASPLDRSAPLALYDHDQSRGRYEDHGRDYDDSEQDFDMSRSVNTSHSSPTRKDHEKPKSSKMGLRKTLAKLSIAIPSHSTHTSPNMAKASRLSPSARITATTPRSTKSLSMASTEDPNSPGSDSPLGDLPLSRQSSGSSMGSFNHMFDKASRKSSIGSTRVMTVSPGPVSPDLNYRGQPRIAPSHLGSVVHSAANSPGHSASHSRAASPTFQPSASPSMDEHRDHITRENLERLDQLSKMPMVPDVRVLEGTPIMEEMGHEERFIGDTDTEHGSFSGSGEVMDAGVNYSLATPDPYAQAWDSGRELSDRIATLAEQDYELQTARGIKDEYYHGRTTPLSEVSDGLSRVPILAPDQRTGDGNPYSTTGQIHSELAALDYVDETVRSVSEGDSGMTGQFRDLELGGNEYEGQDRQSPQERLEENAEQPPWNSAPYEHGVPENQHVVHLDQGMALSPSAMQDSFKSAEPSSSTLFSQLPIGLVLTPRQSPGQSPDIYYPTDKHPPSY